jgi:hypothetical protein
MICRLQVTLVAASLLLLGCPKDKSPPSPDAESVQDVVDTEVVSPQDTAIQADITTPPDIKPELSSPDMIAADLAETGIGKDITYEPADPCAEEPEAPAEGSPCTTLDELKCSDYQQTVQKSFSWTTNNGSEWLQVCKRLYVLRCESAQSGVKIWTRHLAEDLAGAIPNSAGSKAEGVWCLSSPKGLALELGVCADDGRKACPQSKWSARGCAGTGSIRICGTPDMNDALVSEVNKPWYELAAEQLGSDAPYCAQFARRYEPEHCFSRTITCKYPPSNGKSPVGPAPSVCIPDNDTGAHCATTCTELGLENP